jgi:RimJ/RimL family protein N-acetyltransferase
MDPNVHLMTLDEVDLIIDYFHRASPEHLELLGVDPTRLPAPEAWRERYARDLAQPIERRRSLLVLWRSGDTPIGFSTADKIAFGEEAYMHLHILDPAQRRAGLGALCVARTARLYMATLQLQRLFCEPSAFNVAPNRTLQRAGFRYVKTHMTVPGPLNYHQAVTRWLLSVDDR